MAAYTKNAMKCNVCTRSQTFEANLKAQLRGDKM